MADLRNCGVRGILIACVDGLAGFADAITAAFPATVVLRCVVHYADLRVMPTSRRECLVAA
jgi:putative transposase